MKKAVERPEKPGWRDYFQMVTTGIMAVLSLYILWQTFFVRWGIPSLIFGFALLLFSLFRINMIWSYFQQKGRRSGA